MYLGSRRPREDLPVQVAQGLVGGKLKRHVGHILHQGGQVPGEQAADTYKKCGKPSRQMSGS